MGEVLRFGEICQALDRQATGKLPQYMSAHAVGDSPEPVLGAVEAGILVVAADPARMGAGRRCPTKRVRVAAHAGNTFAVNAFWTAPTLIEAPGAEFLTSMFSVWSVRLSAK